ncbi:hypothetical protein A2833_03510 [Candidatus Azambacteria bacterium RIFCSPHIGHO2_01_FULL_44_55]|uniref:Uncharacterized protein n=1 Tax=Candidatus Azambacteria bacterium RIFCSPLOWO2_02_FULL_44_14 TaxID=1797306 RepID=A0A1F5CBX8_9BACT|nr:MAG: hypothetical protein A3C78_01175 [Candidatus Azambacteria bacterium RIFCSPHIGHO2_02_FULL_45_18]OGD40372.1 MAG: hypothetical protein A3I30_03755 [Candidatus Azambacteria bacterium RIFCSPLOWO2_02_FULL_44_14]OGD40817.1 MAG: hypothetical protein A2833_03510 [Candidatus Azambacteria bacterium RIFCSPHIGHO2_01_FULL_44_55]OGD52221.1 MAG: hypothetical protein A2608_02180 [Candidatus Azambacteria bacterium RIFOXYD1_FULL_44_10]
MDFIKEKLNTEIILSFFLAFVVLWFGINEILYTQDWTGLVPNVLKNLLSVNLLVLSHGITLTVCGFALIFNIKRKIAAAVIVVLLLEIVINFLFISGLSGVAVRDVGLLGMALAIIFIKSQFQNCA